MSKKPNMSDINLQLNEPEYSPSTLASIEIVEKTKSSNPNPEKGKRGSFGRLSLTLPVDMLNTLRSVSLNRKITKQKNFEVNAIVREAIASFLEKHLSK